MRYIYLFLLHFIPFTSPKRREVERYEKDIT